MAPTRTIFFIAALAVFSAACEKCAPGQVGDGVARLTVRNVGAVADLVNSDGACGFNSPDVKSHFTTSGAVGAMGTATWSVTNCTLNPSGAVKTQDDCNKVTQSISGSVVVSAKRTVSGTLTGNPDQPVIPTSPDAVLIELESVAFKNFMVEESNSDARLTQITGSLSAKIAPRLAASQSTGVCSVPTRNVHLSAIAYRASTVHVKNPSHDFDIDVSDSMIDAVSGKHSGRENSIEGTISVWGNQVKLPNDGGGLDPSYDNKKLESGYACTPDLKQPVTYTCGDIEPALAQGAARLTIRNFGTIGQLIDDDATCGFSSQHVLSGMQVHGAVGGMGDITYTVSACTLAFPDQSVGEKDCTGDQTIVSGKITVTGTKKVSGKLTGDPHQPVIPMNDTPAVVTLSSVAFDHFKVEKDGTSLEQVDGSISGVITPRIARDATLGACAFHTPIAKLDQVAYAANSKIELGSAQGTFQTVIGGSTLHAVNGTWGTDSNVLSGTIKLGDKPFDLPTNPMDPGLDPMFNQAAFDMSWMCGSLDKQSPFDCSFERPLAQGAAQLTVRTFGALADLIDQDATCGFSSPAVAMSAHTNGNLGDPGGSATFTISQPCKLQFTMQTTQKTDCNMTSTYVTGTAMVTGTKTIGPGYVSGDPSQPIVPTTRDPAKLDLSATFTNFRVWTTASADELTIKSGELSGTVQPRTAIDTTTGACSIVTPVAQISGLKYTNALLEVKSMGKTFDVNVPTSSLIAVNGSRDGQTNSLKGTITLDGMSYDIPVDGHPVLDPMYDQAKFDHSYACLPNMQVPAGDADCNLGRLLAGGSARLLIQALGGLTGVANSDSNCGFSANLTSPSAVIGNDGEQGALEWTIQNCDLPSQGGGGGDNPPPTQAGMYTAGTDCLQRTELMSGKATVGGMRHVDGTRQDIHLLFLTFHSITPNSPQSVHVHMDSVAFTEFQDYSLDPNQMAPSRAITIHSGTMSSLVDPITGEEANTPGKFDIPTKVARMSNVAVNNAAITILYQGKTFNVHVDSAMLSAFNGSFQTTNEKNSINGTISIGGQTYALNNEPLDPQFNQADFDARYACTNNLKQTVPPAQ